LSNHPWHLNRGPPSIKRHPKSSAEAERYGFASPKSYNPAPWLSPLLEGSPIAPAGYGPI
jgi:hypothetical protein